MLVIGNDLYIVKKHHHFVLDLMTLETLEIFDDSRKLFLLHHITLKYSHIGVVHIAQCGPHLVWT